MSKLTDRIFQLASEPAEKLGLSLWDVEYIKEAGQWYLRIYIDKPGGVSITDCEDFSRAFDPILDAEDPIESSYVFEVSSAGIERTLKRPEHFTASIGEKVELRLFTPHDGAKVFVGTLAAFDGTVLTLETGTDTYQFPRAEIAQVRIKADFI